MLQSAPTQPTNEGRKVETKSACSVPFCSAADKKRGTNPLYARMERERKTDVEKLGLYRDFVEKFSSIATFPRKFETPHSRPLIVLA